MNEFDGENQDDAFYQSSGSAYRDEVVPRSRGQEPKPITSRDIVEMFGGSGASLPTPKPAPAPAAQPARPKPITSQDIVSMFAGSPAEEVLEQPKPQAEEMGDTRRGYSAALDATVPLLKGAAGLAGAAGEKAFGTGGNFSDLRKWGFEGYKKGMGEIEARAKDTDDVTKAWEKAKNGDVGALVDWAQYGFGYVAGNIVETVATSVLGSVVGGIAGSATGTPVGTAGGAVGGAVAGATSKGLVKGFVESLVTKEAAKLAEKTGAKEISEEITKQATKNVAKDIGSATAVYGSNILKEIGTTYGEAEELAQKEGRELDAGDLSRVFFAGTLAGLTEGVVDRLGLKVGAGKLQLPGGGRAGRAFVGAVAGGGLEGGTEVVQTVLERYGAGKGLTGEDAINEYINAFALGALGGGTIGGLTGAIRDGKQDIDTGRKLLDTADKEMTSEPGLRELFTKMAADEKIGPILEANDIASADDPRFAGVVSRAISLQKLDAELNIPTREQRIERTKERRADVAAAFGETASTAVGVGMGTPTEGVIQRASVVPDQEAKTLVPVGERAEPVVIPNEQGVSTPAVSGEDIVAAQQGFKPLPGTKIGATPWANRFLNARQAQANIDTLETGNELEAKLEAHRKGGNVFDKEALSAARTQLNDLRVKFGLPRITKWKQPIQPIFPDLSAQDVQIRQGKRSKEAGGGDFFFLEARPLPAGAVKPERVQTKTPAPATPATPAAPASTVGVPSASQTPSGQAPAPAQPGAMASTTPSTMVSTMPSTVPTTMPSTMPTTPVSTEATTQPTTTPAAPVATQTEGTSNAAQEGSQQQGDQRQRAGDDAGREEGGRQDRKRKAAKPEARTEGSRGGGAQESRQGTLDLRRSYPGENVKSVDDLNKAVQQLLDSEGNGEKFRAVKVPIGDLVGKIPGIGLIQATAKAFGKPVVFFRVAEGSDFFNGTVIRGDDTIFINVNASRPHIRIFGHELVHAIRNSDPATYEKLLNALKPLLLAKGFSEFSARQMSEGVTTDHKILEEAVGDIVGDRFGETAFWEMLAENNPTGFRAVAKAVIDFIDKVLAKLSGNQSLGSETLVKDLQAARREIARVLGDAVPSQAEGQGTGVSMSRKSPAADVLKAKKFKDDYDILPYTSEGQIEVPTDLMFSIKREGKYGTHPVLGIPVNKNGTVSLYYPTTNEEARRAASQKSLKAEAGKNRIYLTNESSARKVQENPGGIEQAVGGANVLVQVDPDLVQIDAEYPDGRKDFFIPVAEGQAFFNKLRMTKMFTLNKSRREAISPDATIGNIGEGVTTAIEKWMGSNAAERKALVREAKAVLKQDHNLTTLLGENGKLEKTRVGDYGLTYDGKSVASLGFGMASAQKLNDKKLTTCPQSAICESLCLGETSGQNLLYGGEGKFRSGPRLSQYLKTEALVMHPEQTALVLANEIQNFSKAMDKDGYQPAIRLNVTSDFPPKVFEALIKAFPNVQFYDYTKLDSNPIAPNHHLTYSSTGASQVVNGKRVENPHSNWDRMVRRLNDGFNVAMAFSSRTSMPKFVVDEKTGQRFQVWNGDNYDARFLDPKPGEAGNLLNRGMIIGLTNKDRTTAPEMAAEKNNGFFLNYDAKDGDTLVINDQEALARGGTKVIKIATKQTPPEGGVSVSDQPPAFSRKREFRESDYRKPVVAWAKARFGDRVAPNGNPVWQNFVRWFGDSQVVNEKGEPLVVYHSSNYQGEDGSGFSAFKPSTSGMLGEGIYLTVDRDFAGRFREADPGRYAMPAYVVVKNPAYEEDLVSERERQRESAAGYEKLLTERALANGHDAIIQFGRKDVVGDDRSAQSWTNFIVFDPGQIKSSVGNNGNFNVDDPGISFSRKRESIAEAVSSASVPGAFAQAVRDRIASAILPNGEQRFNWWHKSIGTQLEKARVNPYYRKVYDLGQKFLDDTAMFAMRAQAAAPTILPNLGNMGLRFWKGGISKANNELLGKMLAEGTLLNGPSPMNGKIWTDAELRSRYNATDEQIKLYREARAAIDQSLDDTTKALMGQLARSGGIPQSAIDPLMEAQLPLSAVRDRLVKALQALPSTGKVQTAINGVKKMASETEAMKKGGYAPLMRFGEFVVSVENAKGDVEYFSLHETAADALRTRNEITKQFKGPGFKVSNPGARLNSARFKMFAGLSPSTLEAFFNAVPVTSKAEENLRQEYLQLVVSNRSALARMIQRKGTAGYTLDATRTLASFITSNARHSSKALNMAEISRAITQIPAEQGDVAEEAVKLQEYLQNPQEGVPGIRGFLFFNFLGGSIAAGLVNMTQPVLMTYPYLTQWGAGRASSAMSKAMKDATAHLLKKPTGNKALDAALKKAAERGITQPQEMFQLIAAAESGTSSLLGHKFMRVWGLNFAVSEVFNRVVTFTAAFNLGSTLSQAELQKAGVKDAFEFAVRTVEDTQGKYNKGNRPNWARETGVLGSAGTLMFTFKQYSIAYMEFLKQLYKNNKNGKKALGIALGTLILAAGLSGLPGADDLDDLIDTVGNWMGYPTNSKKWKVKFLTETLGMSTQAANFLLYGISSFLPMDLQARLGLANLIPGTGLLNPTRDNKAREVLDVIGPLGGFAANAADAVEMTAKGNFRGAGMKLAPKAVKDAYQGFEMATTGVVRDEKGRTIQEATATEALVKGIGFNPQSVASEGRVQRMIQADIDIVKSKKEELHEQMARAIVDRDEDLKDKVLDELSRWNSGDPEYRIKLDTKAIQARVKKMIIDRSQRFAQQAPKDMRARIIRDLQEQKDARN